MTLKVTEIPAYTTDGKDAYIGVFFSAAPRRHDRHNRAECNVCGAVQMEERIRNFRIVQDGSGFGRIHRKGRQSSEIKILFGWYGDESQIRIDGQVAMSGSLSKGNFNTAEGLLGYFAVSTYSEADDWSFSISAPRHVELKAPLKPPMKNLGKSLKILKRRDAIALLLFPARSAGGFCYYCRASRS